MPLILKNINKAKAKGQFAEIEGGRVHYELVGPETGQTIVLVHGFLGPMEVWDHNIYQLAEAGFRVLRYDQFGRGFSDRPRLIYNMDLYVRQLEDLLRALKIEQNVSVVGLSMGGAISTSFFRKNPERVNRLCLLGSYCFPRKHRPIARVLASPTLGRSLVRLAGKFYVKRSGEQGFYRPHKFPEFIECLTEQMNYRGFANSLQSTYRNLIMKDFSPEFTNLHACGIPVALTWGQHDAILPLDYGHQVKALAGDVQFRIFEEAGHVFNYETPEVFNAFLIDFLREL